MKNVEPVRGHSLYLEHLMEDRISSLTLRSLHHGGHELQPKNFLTKNKGIEFDESKKEIKVLNSSEKGLVCRSSHSWEDEENLWELVDGVKNYVSAIFMVRPYSYEAIVLDRVLHHIR